LNALTVWNAIDDSARVSALCNLAVLKFPIELLNDWIQLFEQRTTGISIQPKLFLSLILLRPGFEFLLLQFLTAGNSGFYGSRNGWIFCGTLTACGCM
jgi:hypothetical protein